MLSDLRQHLDCAPATNSRAYQKSVRPGPELTAYFELERPLELVSDKLLPDFPFRKRVIDREP